MKVFFIIGAIIAVASAQFQCPSDEDGQFEDPDQCDKYYECIGGELTEKLCPDGLVFDPMLRSRVVVNRCDHVFNVECEDRRLLQEPKPSPNCPRRNGFFAHPDLSVCDVFYNCIEGVANEMECAEGLHFNQETGTCIWAQDSGRQGCARTLFKTKDGFECPKEELFDSNGLLIIHPKYAHPTDCQRFYVCLNGKEPRYLGCPFGEVYNEESQKCDEPENVAGCETWYKDMEPAPEVIKA